LIYPSTFSPLVLVSVQKPPSRFQNFQQLKGTYSVSTLAIHPFIETSNRNGKPRKAMHSFSLFLSLLSLK
jgi:hypothetical protein